MASPYDYSEPDDDRPPLLSTMTVVAVAFAVFMLIYIGITIAEGYKELDERAVQAGDEVTYDFVARYANGTLWETTHLEVAREAAEAGAYEPRSSSAYRPRSAVIDPERPGLSCGPDAERAVMGTKVGETTTFETSARHFTGAWEPFLPEQDGIPREVTDHPFQRLVFYQESEQAAAEGNDHARDIDLDDLNETLGDFSEGYVYNSGATMPPGLDQRFERLDWNNRSLLVRYLVEDGDFFDVPDLPGGVTVLLRDDETRAVYRLDLEGCGTFTVTAGSELNNFGFPPGSYLVNRVGDDRIDLQYREGQTLPPDETITVELTVVNKQAPESDDTTD